MTLANLTPVFCRAMKGALSPKTIFLCVQFSLIWSKVGGSSSDEKFNNFLQETKNPSRTNLCQEIFADDEIILAVAIPDQNSATRVTTLPRGSFDKEFTKGQPITINLVSDDLDEPTLPETGLSEFPTSSSLLPSQYLLQITRPHVSECPLKDSAQETTKEVIRIALKSIPKYKLLEIYPRLSNETRERIRPVLSSETLQYLIQALSDSPPQGTFQNLPREQHQVMIHDMAQLISRHVPTDFLQKEMRDDLENLLQTVPQEILQFILRYTPEDIQVKLLSEFSPEMLHYLIQKLVNPTQKMPQHQLQAMPPRMINLIASHVPKDFWQKLNKGSPKDLLKTAPQETVQSLVDQLPEDTMKKILPKLTGNMWAYLNTVLSTEDFQSLSAMSLDPPQKDPALLGDLNPREKRAKEKSKKGLDYNPVEIGTTFPNKSLGHQVAPQLLSSWDPTLRPHNPQFSRPNLTNVPPSVVIPLPITQPGRSIGKRQPPVQKSVNPAARK